jgi:hypothetical protein
LPFTQPLSRPGVSQRNDIGIGHHATIQWALNIDASEHPGRYVGKHPLHLPAGLANRCGERTHGPITAATR